MTRNIIQNLNYHHTIPQIIITEQGVRRRFNEKSLEGMVKLFSPILETYSSS